MKQYRQINDVTLIGVEVKTFPTGITEAFNGLMKNLGATRNYYGVSWMDERDRVRYYAMAEELLPGEGKAYQYETLTLDKGEYRVEEIKDWMSKTDCIKDVFQQLLGEGKPAAFQRCIEWYRSDKEMLCMLRLNDLKS